MEAPLAPKTNQPFGCFLFSQTLLLHEGLNYNNNKIIHISTFNNMLKFE
jgi:hypothetical protein